MEEWRAGEQMIELAAPASFNAQDLVLRREHTMDSTVVAAFIAAG